MFHASQEHSSRIILAIDAANGSQEHLFQKSRKLFHPSVQYLCGLKLGRQTVLNLGTKRTQKLIGIAKDEMVPAIIDDKLNDIDETNKQIATAYFNMGFDGIIVNPFAGWKGGLASVFQLAHALDKGVIALVYMSHPGADRNYGQLILSRGKTPRPQYMIFAQESVKWGADGAIVGATRPAIIREVKRVLGRKVPIYSPGVGTQGGKLREASQAGADYFIIGRSITRAVEPVKMAARLAEQSISTGA